jgi:hypothetical protein
MGYELERTRKDDFFRALSRKLGSYPSLAYAAIYVALIPSFAIVYSLLPGHFYHSTIQYERSQVNKAGQLEFALLIAFWNNLGNHGPGYTVYDDWSVSDGATWIDSLKSDADNLDFTLHLRLFKDNARESPSLDLSPRFAMVFDRGNNVMVPKARINGYQLVRLVNPDSTVGFDARRLMLALFPKTNAAGADLRADEYVIYMSPAEVESLIDYLNSMEGFPSTGTWDHFWRMLYLSASTITTLGLGDVVPITGTARALIAMESVMGIVLIGLFLNALSYERAQPEK